MFVIIEIKVIITGLFLLVPLSIVTDLRVVSLNVSSIHLTWRWQNDDTQLLNGNLRAFAVTLYESFSKLHQSDNSSFTEKLFSDMSTLSTIETVNPYLIVNDLHSSSEYYMSVTVCNYFDCGPSSVAIRIETPSTSK
jgi:hypothetical protein